MKNISSQHMKTNFSWAEYFKKKGQFTDLLWV